MTSTATGRLNSANSSRAVKAPVRSVCTTNITASGLSAITTIDGSLTPAADDRFLLAGQTSSVDNGIYVASSGTWTRSTDFDTNRDVAKGTLIVTESGLTYRLTSSNPIVIGTTALTFASNDSSTIVASLASTAVGAGASLVGTNDAGSLFTSATVEGNLQECVVTGAVNQSVAGNKTLTGTTTLSGPNTLSGATTISGTLNMTSTVSRHGVAAYMLKGVTTYTSGSGTYTVPTGVRAIRVMAVGGGGGGGYANAITTANAQAVGGPGQGGFYFELFITSPAASYLYAVGAAGTGGVGSTSTAATDGGDTTFGSFTAKGGEHGEGISVATAVFGAEGCFGNGAPSANAGAVRNLRGQFGQPGRTVNQEPGGLIRGSHGGSSPFAGPTSAGNASASDQAATGGAGDGYGGGGGGGIAWRNAIDFQIDGGAGTSGLIVIEEYY